MAAGVPGARGKGGPAGGGDEREREFLSVRFFQFQKKAKSKESVRVNGGTKKGDTRRGE